MLMPTMRSPSRRISKTEKGRRRRESIIGAAFTMTNWPGCVRSPISGAAIRSTL
jgi:hypothetical protein